MNLWDSVWGNIFTVFSWVIVGLILILILIGVILWWWLHRKPPIWQNLDKERE
jgi:hypothetical protein